MAENQNQNGTQAANGQAQGTQGDQAQSQAVSFDYEKLASIINGRTQSAEESALKGYFKQQGLTADEMTQAINAFKEQKKANTPDVADLQAKLDAANKANRDMLVNNAATQAALSMGVDIKTTPYLIKLADLAEVVGEDGKILEEKMQEALKKVLEDVPALKTSQSTGFVQLGADGQQKGNASDTDATLDRIFGLKK